MKESRRQRDLKIWSTPMPDGRTKIIICANAGEKTLADCARCYTDHTAGGDALAEAWLKRWPTRCACKQANIQAVPLVKTVSTAVDTPKKHFLAIADSERGSALPPIKNVNNTKI